MVLSCNSARHGGHVGVTNDVALPGLDLSLDRAADGYRAMDERRAVKTLLRR